MMRKNPLTVRGCIRRCWLFSWRAPEATVRALVPPPIQLVTRGGFAFWNVVVCEMAAMRPAPLPAWVGLGYWHVAYRLHVLVREAHGGDLEGLYFVRSDCDRRLVAAMGNVLTDFRFQTAQIDVSDAGASVAGRIVATGADAHFGLDRMATPSLAGGSPFADLTEAASFLKYKPRAFSPHAADAVNAVRVIREESAWRSRSIAVVRQEWEFFADREATLELCTEVQPIDYQWNRGDIVRVRP